MHITALERFILGDPLPSEDLPDDLPHVKNDIGRSNERWIESRRSWTGADALAEFVATTDARIAQLRALDDDGFAADSWTPMGPGTVAELLGFRIFDSWVHEQDMRGRPRASRRPRLRRRPLQHPDDARRAAVRDREEGGGSRRFHRRAHAHRPDRPPRPRWRRPTVAPARSSTVPELPTVTLVAGLRRLRPPRLRPPRPRRGAGHRRRARSRATSISAARSCASSTTCSDLRHSEKASTDGPGHQRRHRQQRRPPAVAAARVRRRRARPRRPARLPRPRGSRSRRCCPAGRWPRRPGSRGSTSAREDPEAGRREPSPRRSPRSTTCSTPRARSTGSTAPQAVVGGFSQGGGLALALGLGPTRARPSRGRCWR